MACAVSTQLAAQVSDIVDESTGVAAGNKAATAAQASGSEAATRVASLVGAVWERTSTEPVGIDLAGVTVGTDLAGYRCTRCAPE